MTCEFAKSGRPSGRPHSFALILGRPGASLFSEQTVEAPESPFRAKGGQSEAVDIKAEVVDLQSPPLRRFSTADGTFPVKASPASSLEVIEADLLLELLIITFDSPSDLRQADELF